MFTCIIPTLWKSPRIVRLVKELNDCSSVGEIIIIDNAPGDALMLLPENHGIPLPSHDKLRRIKMQKNIYVNPAWNLGVKEARYDDIALINDDVNFDVNGLSLLDDGRLKTKGVIGVGRFNGGLKIWECGGHYMGWGYVILVNKLNYIPIPDDLLIWCGDNWLTIYQPIYAFDGLKLETEMCTTSGLPEFTELKYKDHNTFHSKYNNDGFKNYLKEILERDEQRVWI